MSKTTHHLCPLLVVDDERDNLEALTRLLRGEFQISVAESADEALQQISRGETFHILVSDQRMPGMSGVDFFEKAKEISPHSTRILLTGYTDLESVIAAINRGHIYGYVTKPWDPEGFKILLRQAAGNFHLRSELIEKNNALEKASLEIGEALEKISAVDRAKSRFLSLISHELNTPLTVLRSFVDLLSRDRELLPPERGRALSALSRAEGRLSEIVSQVLDYVRVEASGMEKRESIRLEQELLVLARKLARDVEKKKLRLTVESKGEVILRGSRDLVRIALLRLAEESLAMAPAGSQVRIVLRGTESRWQIRIEREGPPLTEETLEPFEVAGDLAHHSKGLGLKLAICRAIMGRHGAGMRALSVRPGVTGIEIFLPAGSSAPVQERTDG